MNLYIGLIESIKNSKRFVVFRSGTIPTKKKHPFFKKVMGPFKTQKQVEEGLHILKHTYGYKENPVRCKCGIGCSGRKSNPGELYHNKMFLRQLKSTEGMEIGSPEYIAMISRAYENMHLARESARQGIY